MDRNDPARSSVRRRAGMFEAAAQNLKANSFEPKRQPSRRKAGISQTIRYSGNFQEQKNKAFMELPRPSFPQKEPTFEGPDMTEEKKMHPSGWGDVVAQLSRGHLEEKENDATEPPRLGVQQTSMVCEEVEKKFSSLRKHPSRYKEMDTQLPEDEKDVADPGSKYQEINRFQQKSQTLPTPEKKKPQVAPQPKLPWMVKETQEMRPPAKGTASGDATNMHGNGLNFSRPPPLDDRETPCGEPPRPGFRQKLGMFERPGGKVERKPSTLRRQPSRHKEMPIVHREENDKVDHGSNYQAIRARFQQKSQTLPTPERKKPPVAPRPKTFRLVKKEAEKMESPTHGAAPGDATNALKAYRFSDSKGPDDRETPCGGTGTRFQDTGSSFKNHRTKEQKPQIPLTPEEAKPLVPPAAPAFPHPVNEPLPGNLGGSTAPKSYPNPLAGKTTLECSPDPHKDPVEEKVKKEPIRLNFQQKASLFESPDGKVDRKSFTLRRHPSMSQEMDSHLPGADWEVKNKVDLGSNYPKIRSPLQEKSQAPPTPERKKPPPAPRPKPPLRPPVPPKPKPRRLIKKETEQKSPPTHGADLEDAMDALKPNGLNFNDSKTPDDRETPCGGSNYQKIRSRFQQKSQTLPTPERKKPLVPPQPWPRRLIKKETEKTQEQGTAPYNEKHTLVANPLKLSNSQRLDDKETPCGGTRFQDTGSSFQRKPQIPFTQEEAKLQVPPEAPAFPLPDSKPLYENLGGNTAPESSRDPRERYVPISRFQETSFSYKQTPPREEEKLQGTAPNNAANMLDTNGLKSNNSPRSDIREIPHEGQSTPKVNIFEATGARPKIRQNGLPLHLKASQTEHRTQQHEACTVKNGEIIRQESLLRPSPDGEHSPPRHVKSSKQTARAEQKNERKKEQMKEEEEDTSWITLPDSDADSDAPIVPHTLQGGRKQGTFKRMMAGALGLIERNIYWISESSLIPKSVKKILIHFGRKCGQTAQHFVDLGRGVYYNEAEPLQEGHPVFPGVLDGTHPKLVAVKIIDGTNDKLLREAEHLCKLNHENVINLKLSDFFIVRGRERIYLVMDMCDKTLSEVVEKKDFGTISEKEILRQVVSGLWYLHKKEIIHRDLKPQNILFLEGKVKLSDFGFSKSLRPGCETASLSGTKTGTLDYNAPETHRYGTTSKQTDVFSAGILFFFVLSHGHHPFGERYERHYNISKGILEDPWNLLQCEDPDIAKHLINKMLEHKPESRPSTDAILKQPFFWEEKKKLEFLSKSSDTLMSSKINPIIEDVEKILNGENWLLKLSLGDEELRHIRNRAKGPDELPERDTVIKLATKRGKNSPKYNFQSVTRLLRFIRNRHHHYKEDVKDKKLVHVFGSKKAIWAFFSKRFPTLFCEIYRILKENRTR